MFLAFEIASSCGIDGVSQKAHLGKSCVSELNGVFDERRVLVRPEYRDPERILKAPHKIESIVIAFVRSLINESVPLYSIAGVIEVVPFSSVEDHPFDHSDPECAHHTDDNDSERNIECKSKLPSPTNSFQKCNNRALFERLKKGR